MKKILTIFAVMAILAAVPVSVNALTTVNVDSQRDINKGMVNQIMTKKAAESAAFEAKIEELTSRYLNNIRTCEPLHYSQHIDIFGLKVDVNININGWVDNKCKYELSGKVGGLGKDIREVFDINISDEAISKFEPKIECNFTQNDLNIIVAAILARNERNEVLVSQMLESPEKKLTQKKPELSPEEEQLVSLLVSGQACKVLNKEELMNNFSELMNSGGL